MNNKFLFALTVSVLVVACEPMQRTLPGECDTIDIPACTGSASNPKLGITLVRDGIRVGPRNVCVNANTTIEVSMHPRQSEYGTVKTVPKDPNDSWLEGSNDTDLNSFDIVVPELPSGKDYDYTIIRSNGVCLDPRVHVE